MISTTESSRISLGRPIANLVSYQGAKREMEPVGLGLKLKRFINLFIPEVPLGYEDESGFHFGVEPRFELSEHDSE